MSMTRKPRHRAETTSENAEQVTGRVAGNHRRDSEGPTGHEMLAVERAAEVAQDDAELRPMGADRRRLTRVEVSQTGQTRSSR